MKTCKPRQTILSSTIAALLGLTLSGTSQAADVTWDITPGTVGVGDGAVTGGLGAWNLTNGNWTINAGVNNIAWVNANNDNAIFGGTAGTVTLGTGINVGGLQFNTAGYTVTGSTLTFGAAGNIATTANATISSVLAGSAAITKTGTGTLTLNNTGSTYSGQLTVANGTLSIAAINNVSSNGNLGNSDMNLPVILGSSGQTGTLQYTAATGSSDKAFSIATGGTGVFDISTALTLTGTISGSGNLNKTGAGNLTLSQTFSNTGLFTASQFTGVTTINSGKIVLSVYSTGNNFGAGSLFGLQKSVYDTTGSSASLDVTALGAGNGVLWLGGLQGSVALATAVSGYGQITYLNLNPQTGTSVSYGGVIANGAANMIVDKLGPGTQTLTAANTYSGATNIFAGTLALSGATGSALNSAFTVRGGTLLLDNTSALVNRLADTTALSLGSLTLRSNTAAGTQSETVGATSFATGGKVTVDLNGGTAQTTLAMGAVTRSAGAAIDFVGVGGTLGGGASSPNVTSTATFPGGSNGILPWATVNGTAWAGTTSTTSIVAYDSVANPFVNPTSATSDATKNAQLTGSGTMNATKSFNSLNVISSGTNESFDLSTAGVLTLTSGGILKSGANAYTISGSAANAITSGTELIAHVDGGALTISAPLNPAIVNIAKGGTGNLILSGTRIATMNGAISIAGGDLEFQGAATTLSGVVSGAGGIVANLNAGQLFSLTNGANTFTGRVLIKGGIFQGGSFNSFGLSAAPGSGNNTVGSTGVNTGSAGGMNNIELNGGLFAMPYVMGRSLGAGPDQIQITGGASGFTGNSSTTNFVFGGTANYEVVWGSTFFQPTTLVLQDATNTAGIFNFNNKVDLNGSTRTVAVNAAAAANGAAITGSIRNSTGTAGFTKTGVGYLTLSGTNTYNGGTNINAGTLSFAKIVSMPSTGVVAVTDATIGIALGGAGEWAGTGSGVGTLNGLLGGVGGAGTSTVTYSGNVGLELNVTTGTVTPGNLTNTTLTGATTLAISKSGAGILSLSGTNTYSAGTSISGGTVQFTNLVSMPATGTVAVNAATLAVGLGGTGQWTTSTTGNGTLGGLVASSAVGGQGNTVTWAGASTVGFDTTNASGLQTYSGNIVNRGTSLGVTKLGLGALTLSGTNTYTGTTTLSAGTLNMSGTFGNTPITVNGGLLNFTSSSGGNGLVTVAGGTFLYAGTKTAGSVTQSGGTLQLGTATSSGLGAITISGGAVTSDGTTARTYTPRFVMNGSFTLGDGVNNGKLTFTDAGGTNNSTTGSAQRTVTVLSDVEFTTGLGGTGGILKQGPGTLTLSGVASNYTAATTVSGGSFTLGSGGGLGATAVTVNNGGTFAVKQTASGTSNTGTTSTMTLAAGALLTMADGFTSTLNVTGATTLAPASGTAPVLTFDIIGATNRDVLAIAGAATVGAGTAKIAISPTSTPTAGSSYTVITAASGLNTNFTLDNSLLPTASGLMSLAFTGSSATAQVVAVSNAANTVYWQGQSSPNISNISNYNTTVAGGVVASGSPSLQNLVFSTTTPAVNLQPTTASGALTVNSVNFLPGSSATTISGGNTLTVNANINDSSSTNQTFNAPLSVTGNLNINRSGGVLALANGNTISGAVNLNSGTLLLANANAITATSGITTTTASPVITAGGTTIQLRSNTSASFNTGLITLPGNGTLNIDVDNNGSGAGNTLTLGTANVALTGGASGAITTPTGVVNSSVTTLNVTGNNGYGLALGRIQQPTAAVGSAFTVNTTVPVLINQFQAGSFGNNFIAGSGTITLGVSGSGTPGFTQGSNGTNTITVNSGATLIMPTAVGSYNNRSAGGFSTVLNSGGTLVLNNASSLANTSAVSAPNLTINGGTLDSTQSGGIVITAGTTTSPAQTWNGDFTFTGTQNLNLGNGAVAVVGDRTVTVTANTLTVGGSISGAGITKAGNGTLVLTGASTYTGATTVNAGTLLVNGSLSGSSAVSATGGTLGGTGTVGAVTVSTTGIIAPGTGTGILNTGNVTFSGGTAAYEIFGTTVGTNYDQLSVTGTVGFTANTALTIDLGVFDPVDFTDTFTLINNDSSDAVSLGGFAFTYAGDPLTEGKLFNVGSQYFTISYVGGTGNDVVISAVPEPGSALMLAGGLATLLGFRRRRQS